MSYCNVPFPAPATQSHAPTLPGTSIDCACPQMSHWCCACHTTSHCNVPFSAPATQSPLQRYQDASITCHQMSHWCCACHATSRCNAHATYSLHQPPRPTLQRYQDASIDCACRQMSHWCCACHTTSHCNVPFSAPATQSHAPTLPGCFNHLPPNVTLVLRLPHNVTLQRTCNVPFPAPATQSHAPTLPGCFNRLRLPPNVTLVLRLPHNVTMQRTIPCTSHTDPRCNWKCHVYKRANFTCTSEPISRVQANPRPVPNPPNADGRTPVAFWGLAFGQLKAFWPNPSHQHLLVGDPLNSVGFFCQWLSGSSTFWTPWLADRLLRPALVALKNQKNT